MALSDDDLLVDSDRSRGSVSDPDSDDDDEDDQAAALRLQDLHARVTASNSYEDHVNVPVLPFLSVSLLSMSCPCVSCVLTPMAYMSLPLFHQFVRVESMDFLGFS